MCCLQVGLKLVSCAYSFVFLSGHRTVHVALSFGSSAKEIFQVEGLAEMSVFCYEVGSSAKTATCSPIHVAGVRHCHATIVAGCRG